MEDKKEFDVKEDNKKRKKYRAMILYIVLFIGIGYAFLQAALNITGTTGVATNTWNIYIDDESIITDGSNGTKLLDDVTIDDTSITFSLEFGKPGDYAEGTFDVVNGGTISAMISDVEVLIDNSTTLPPYLSYSFSYGDGTPFAPNHLLRSGARMNFKFRIEYNKNINPNQLPNTQQVHDFQLNLSFVQANDNAIDVNGLYSISSTPFAIGQPIPSEVNTYYTFDDAKTAFGYPVAIRHVFDRNDNITESIITFEYNGQIYNISSNDSFEEVLSMLSNSFDDRNCYYEQGNGGLCNINESESSNNILLISAARASIDGYVVFGGVWDNIDGYGLVVRDGYGCVLYNQHSLCGDSLDLLDYCKNH